MLKIALVLCAAAVLGAMGQTPSFGKCPTVQTQKSLNISQYLGTWYEIEAFPNWFQPGSCARAQYSMKADGHILVNNTQVHNGQPDSIEGDAFRPNDKEQGKLKVRFSSSQPYGNYWVVHTDYKQFSLIYSCYSVLGLLKAEFAWILARTPTLPKATVDSLKGELAAFGVDTSKFKFDDQTASVCAVL